ncbi:methyltransferase domain containing protein [Acanthamoeba castellanii str. Neff]|uniref:Methyltransferase domain containing protein n=1 Tax=Acanthamoeba castellanii (strain ATCC 30010 / Neff) TaxID=1257118 RepID=L8GV98_ACACF|nr:methyltransferase domain containing protein [Acanthamoeba castellanii str. Neff]ELR17109.1 methyltransferase domain containing protein [Acanthamoeba castellanii str. Neff]
MRRAAVLQRANTRSRLPGAFSASSPFARGQIRRLSAEGCNRISCTTTRLAAAPVTMAWSKRGLASSSDSAEEQRAMNVFNRHVKRLQRDRAAADPESQDYDYLRKEIAARLADRLNDILDREFPSVLALGGAAAGVAEHLQEIPGVKRIVQLDSSLKPERVVADEELIPFEEGTFDLVISNLALHWVNDLPGVLAQIRRVLKPDGLFLASMFGEETLWELRNAFLVAEQDRDGGISNHVSPFAGVSDVGDLLTRAKFALPTIDQEEVVVDFADAFTLMRDLRGMGESNAQHFRRPYVPRSTMYAAAAAYKALYGKEDGRVVYMIGWCPHESQQKPKERGSAQFSLKEFAHSVGELKVVDDNGNEIAPARPGEGPEAGGGDHSCGRH